MCVGLAILVTGWIPPDLLDLTESLTILRLYRNLNLSGERVTVLKTAGTGVALFVFVIIPRLFLIFS